MRAGLWVTRRAGLEGAPAGRLEAVPGPRRGLRAPGRRRAAHTRLPGVTSQSGFHPTLLRLSICPRQEAVAREVHGHWCPIQHQDPADPSPRTRPQPQPSGQQSAPAGRPILSDSWGPGVIPGDPTMPLGRV